jgi:hypothetical protein
MNQNDEAESPAASGEPEAHTPAYATFSSNAEQLKHLFGLMLRGMVSFHDDLDKRIAPEVEVLLGRKPDISIDAANIAQRLSQVLLEPVNQFTHGTGMFYRWVPTILVTIAEAYLQDVLVYQAVVDPAIMASSGQTASYADVIGARSLEELTKELRVRKARKFVSSGGPASWIKQLTRMGARGYRPGLDSQLETLWGVRHVVVHSTGVATQEFVRRNPEFGAKPGENIVIGSRHLSAWVEAIDHFIEVTDCFFIQRYARPPA